MKTGQQAPGYARRTPAHAASLDAVADERSLHDRAAMRQYAMFKPVSPMSQALERYHRQRMFHWTGRHALPTACQ